jgi:lactate permease
MWQQNYEPVGGSLGMSAAVASIPILVLFFMLGAMRKPAWMAALTALVIAFLISIVRVPHAGAAGRHGHVERRGLRHFPIAWIVFASIMLYRLAVNTGSSRSSRTRWAA